MELELTLLTTGYCLHPGFVAAPGLGSRPMRFPAMVALIRHPTFGPVLFDTGYAPRVFSASDRWPYRLYRWITPIRISQAEAAAAQIAALGIDPGEVGTVILSHFHADHVSGLADFYRARVLCRRPAWEGVRQLRGVRALRAAFLPDLIEPGTEQRMVLIDDAVARPVSPTFGLDLVGYDLLGDGSVWGIDLPGHALGQMGLLLGTPHGPAFLVADAIWSSLTLAPGARASALGRVFTPDRAGWLASVGLINRLRAENPRLHILPTHCAAAHERWGRLVRR